jgi:hypothetical protein
MSDDPDLPYDPNTTRFRAMFVRDGSKASALDPDIQASVGYDPLKLPAMVVPQGGSAPGHPYVAIGRAQFRPEPPPDPPPGFTSWQRPRPSQPVNEPAPGSGEQPPPTPAAAYPQSNPLAAGLPVWRGMTNFAGIRRRPPAANAGESDTLQAATGNDMP